ncbi:uncharacterized protein LOC113235462 [Hyposmocoma kahamanoa]|uniref:uncharacterized protein LOC113235462 n=1 Tax=Hyposmocoma kahamanoa TaxID=1477025 RepID=UPI000E6D9D05|nr:uncharacterized protein LOC113235462 [Hyposmocoma kahamanoa]
MGLKIVPVMLGLLQIAVTMPVTSLQDLEVADDTMSVGSYIREVRAAPPDYDKSYESEGDGEVGYSRKKSGSGKRGYQHFDSYHKKAGDNYEFEKQDSFGHDEDAEEGAHSHQHEQREKYRKPKKNRLTPRYTSTYEPYEVAATEHDEKERPRPERLQDHPHYEEIKEGAPDGNGGIEAFGHDPNDYILPQKYTVLSDDDYKN